MLTTNQKCKFAPKCDDVVIIRCYGARRARAGLLRSFYGPAEVDAFAAYCPETHRCYFIKMAELDGRYHMQLRLTETRNNQRSGVNWAKDFEFAAKLATGLGP